MIAISIFGGVIGVVQTLLSNQVGQRVMHDLRSQVYRHLQRLSLAFFTRTRTGEVQSRISNDIGGVQSVVTSTATSIVSNVTTVVATIVAMIALDWRLALFALMLLPFFILLTRRVGNERRKIAKTTQETLADISSLVQESLSVSGIMLGKTMGRSRRARRPFRRRLAPPCRPRDSSADGRPVGHVLDPDELLDHARRRVLVRRLAIARGNTAITIGDPRRLHDAADAAAVPGRLAARRPASTCRPRSRSSTGSSSTSTSPSTSRKSRDAITVGRAGDVVFDRVWFRYDDLTSTLEDVSFTVPAGTTTAIVGETGSGKTTLGYLAARFTT